MAVLIIFLVNHMGQTSTDRYP